MEVLSMPAVSKKQRQLMAIAEHSPEKISAENSGVLKMTHSQLHDFASTDEKGLPVQVKKETKRTTTVKHKDTGTSASKGQRKQINDLIK
jgi:hypothetical protein